MDDGFFFRKNFPFSYFLLIFHS